MLMGLLYIIQIYNLHLNIECLGISTILIEGLK